MESTRYQERLTPDNAALLLIDHQVGLFTGVRDIPVAELKHNVVALAKALKVLSVPIIAPSPWKCLKTTRVRKPVLSMARWICHSPVWSANWREHSLRVVNRFSK